MPHDDVEKIKENSLNWVLSFVIELNLCPFAKKVITDNTLGIKVSLAQKLEPALEAVMSAVGDLDRHTDEETTLLIFPSMFHNFLDYLDFVSLAEKLLSMQGYNGVYQLATFHPEYCFADIEQDDVSNYTNRSPYPMIHILKEDSIEKAIGFYGNTESIPEKNILLMHQLGLSKIKQLIKIKEV